MTGNKDKKKKPKLIELSDDEKEQPNDFADTTESSSSDSGEYEKEIDRNISKSIEEVGSEEEYDIVLVERDDIDSKDSKIKEFIDFCLENRLFNDSFYDYGNVFSVFATRLPLTFEKLSINGETVDKEVFVGVFKEIGFDGDTEYIFNKIKQKDKTNFNWDDILDFFLPFVRYITV